MDFTLSTVTLHLFTVFISAAASVVANTALPSCVEALCWFIVPLRILLILDLKLHFHL